MTKIAAIQMASGPNVQANLDEAEKFIKIAVLQGAELVVCRKILPLWVWLKPTRWLLAKSTKRA